MSAECNHKATTEVVERIVASGALGVGERQVSLLRYLVNEELCGPGDQIKAYTIGAEVLGRGPAFDPSQDAIVRVEVGRLRKTLDLYFATQGRDSSLYIVIDKGTYRPKIIANTDSPARIQPEPMGLLQSTAAVSRSTRTRHPIAFSLVGALLLLMIVTATGLIFTTHRADDPATVEAPLLLVQRPEISGVAEQAELLRFSLQSAMLQELRTRSWFNVSLIESVHTAKGKRLQPVFHLRTYMAAINDHYLLTVILEREPTHEIVWTGRVEGEFDPNNMSAFQRYMAEAISKDLASLNGPIVEAVAVRSEVTSAQADTPFRCMINVRRYLRFNDVKQYENAKSCLTRLIDQDPSQNELRAMLVYLLTEEAILPHLSPLPVTINGRKILTYTGRRDALFQMAEGLLDKSVPIDRSLLGARLTLAACRGQSEIVRSRLSALRGLQSNNPDAYVGMGLLAGPALEEWPLAISAEARAFSLKASPLPWYQFISAIKAGMDDEPGAALRLLSRVPMNNNVIGNAMTVAFGLEAEAYLRVNNARANLARLGYGDTAALLTLIDGSCYAPAVKERIKRGLLTRTPSSVLGRR